MSKLTKYLPSTFLAIGAAVSGSFGHQEISQGLAFFTAGVTFLVAFFDD